MQAIYPFAALVGQDQLKTALMICAVSPSVGGVLIRGEKGTAKSTAARGLAEILPPIATVRGCAFNCLPDAPAAICPACADQPEPSLFPVPFVNLPLGATEDRVLGSLDVEQALKEGRKKLMPGLLASAHRGILYIDEVNLLADHLVDVLLDVAAMGVNTVQREGLSLSHAARVTLIGTMNLEEGDLRPQLLDRFGLMVEVNAPREPKTRAEVVRRRMAFEADPASFAQAWSAEQEVLRARIRQAQSLLPQISMSDALLEFISQLCCEFGVASLRADIVMQKAARALAALAGRQEVTLQDIHHAAQLVLPHRRRKQPFEQAGLDQQRLDDMVNSEQRRQQQKEDDSSSPESATDRDDEQALQGEDGPPPDGGSPEESDAAESTFSALRRETVKHLVAEGQEGNAAEGRRSAVQGARRGQYVRAVPNENPSDIAVDATLRHAMLKGPGPLKVSRSDLHEKVKVGKTGNLILLVVDASGSVGARKRMEAVKGTVLRLLEDAYQRRDEVAVIAFRGTDAEVLLPPTRQVEMAQQALDSLPTGGRTPLPHALKKAAELLSRSQPGKELAPMLVIMSDGKANVGFQDGSDAWQQTLAMAEELSSLAVPTLVLDTEADFVRLGRAKMLADALQAECLPLDDLSVDSLTLAIRQRLS